MTGPLYAGSIAGPLLVCPPDVTVTSTAQAPSSLLAQLVAPVSVGTATCSSSSGWPGTGVSSVAATPPKSTEVAPESPEPTMVTVLLPAAGPVGGSR